MAPAGLALAVPLVAGGGPAGLGGGLAAVLVGLSGCNDACDCAPAGVEDPVCAPFVDAPGVANGGLVALVLELLIGARRLVERLRMSLPFTTRLSFDFRRSLVSISVCSVSMCYGEPPTGILTISTNVQVKHAADAHVDHSKETLVLFLELLLVKDLNCEYTLVGRAPVISISILLSEHMYVRGQTYMSKLSFQYGLSVFLITPVVLVCSPPIVATAKGSGKPVRVHDKPMSRLTRRLQGLPLTKDISLVKTIGSDDCDVC